MGEDFLERGGSPAEQAQALFVLLPDKEVALELGAPFAGEKMYWSTAGDEIETTMTHSAAAGTLTAKVNYQIENNWDYAYLEASPDGSTWTAVNTNRSTSRNPNGQNQGFGAVVPSVSSGPRCPTTYVSIAARSAAASAVGVRSNSSTRRRHASSTSASGERASSGMRTTSTGTMTIVASSDAAPPTMR